ncbi:hypothetical protein GCM10010435_53050 [Winogradskya consettensis]|uniref:ESX-1 secretion-associated protein n=1 Tax=Winogradskya consettensis TaxID=113560 RepID=A0A919SFW6_9ACTN|nr:type VII secretion target [Actinoplanes consettensis]GIM71662.1 hypothetical protein Aco04nite_26390 [Actinoplanes consettensis]
MTGPYPVRQDGATGDSSLSVTGDSSLSATGDSSLSAAGHFSVRADDVAAHAVHVEALAGSVASAADAAASVQAGADAYGELCAMIPAALGDLHATLTGTLRTASTTLHDIATHLHATADDYDATDRAREQVFRTIRNLL